MPVPRNRTSNARKNNRRSHHAPKKQFLATCPNCDSKYKPHNICHSCGYYDGNKVLQVSEAEETE